MTAKGWRSHEKANSLGSQASEMDKKWLVVLGSIK